MAFGQKPLPLFQNPLPNAAPVQGVAVFPGYLIQDPKGFPVENKGAAKGLPLVIEDVPEEFKNSIMFSLSQRQDVAYIKFVRIVSNSLQSLPGLTLHQGESCMLTENLLD